MSKLGQMLPKNERERQLMEFWYQKGVHETEQMNTVKQCAREVEIRYEELRHPKKEMRDHGKD